MNAPYFDKITIYCQFIEKTANGILMKGRAQALAELGMHVHLIYQPFKINIGGTTNYRNMRVRHGPGFRQTTRYPAYLIDKKLFSIFKLPTLFFDIAGITLNMVRSDFVYVHKALPLSLMYILLLRMLRYKGKILLILDDWEGIGGFATTRNADKPFSRLLVSAAEELCPVFCDGIHCVSRILFDKMQLSATTRTRSILLPNGSNLKPPRKLPADKPDIFTVGYIGTFKNEILVDFLVEIITSPLLDTKALRFKIIGGGSLAERFEEQCRKRAPGRDIQFLGQIDHCDIPGHLESINLCLLVLFNKFPDTYVDESRSSTKMFEYMAFGKSILSSAIGEPLAIIKNGLNGFLVQNTPEDFARKITDLTQDYDSILRTGENAREDFMHNYAQIELMKKFRAWADTLPPRRRNHRLSER